MKMKYRNILYQIEYISSTKIQEINKITPINYDEHDEY